MVEEMLKKIESWTFLRFGIPAVKHQFINRVREKVILRFRHSISGFNFPYCLVVVLTVIRFFTISEKLHQKDSE